MQNSLYIRHLEILLQRYLVAMSSFKLDAIVIASGKPSYYFEDDNSHPYKPFAAAQQWLPFDLPAGCYIVIQHDKPELIWPAKQDFWHMDNPIPEGEWQAHWHIIPALNDDWLTSLPERVALIGPDPVGPLQHSPTLLTWLNYDRATKTDYEIACLEAASDLAVKGHLAAQSAFLAGASEFDTHLAYLKATTQDACDTPYPNIVAINEHAAVLHYEQKAHHRPFRPLTLLVDAGAQFNGYASDITRTTTALQDDFSALVADMDALQQGIAAQAVAGTPFLELHQKSLIGVAGLLNKHDICSLSVEEQLEKRIPHHFYPHGLGHLLGLQVHDVGGRQTNPQGQIIAPPKSSPFVRLTRHLNDNMVLTIEPGLYFIPMLLEKLRAEQPQHGCNLDKIEQLRPYGGVRIEDNIVVGVEGVRNLTRERFAKYG
ncbi:Xaa-Pro dipeptidase [Marinomonas aquimarina]|uniref:Xaa-Pro dipeptidase n=1 Tax=Marinomonas aquimarina TaxID=295068 RepID=A0A1A8TJ44_9GAMM|nr:Xaa-Pro dipeptidase [Marinomonas aquimarina]SBS32230.1 Xaa-Pro dipeptidase [Marinomonas aquimarina]